MGSITARNVKNILTQVPEEDWIVGIFTNEINKCCAQGHYYRLASENTEDYSINNCTSSKLYFYFDYNHRSNIGNVNNGNDLRYEQKTAKKRVMAFLDDCIAREEKELPPKSIANPYKNISKEISKVKEVLEILDMGIKEPIK